MKNTKVKSIGYYNDLVSVVMPAYNAGIYIKEAIKSVLIQTYSKFELIIVDDASTDNTAEIVSSFSDYRIRLIRHCKNMGVSAARNTALKVAKGRWIALIDADDAWMPDRLNLLLSILGETRGNYFIGNDHFMCFDTPCGLKPWISAFRLYRHIFNINFDGDIADLSFTDFLKAGAPTVPIIFPAEVVKKYGVYYNTNLSHSEDFEFYCRLFKIGLRFKLYKKALYFYRMTPNSATKIPDNFGGRVKALKILLSDNKFTKEEKILLKNMLHKEEKEAIYRRFAYLLKIGKIMEALHILYKHPYLFNKLLYSLPSAFRYRIARAIIIQSSRSCKAD